MSPDFVVVAQEVDLVASVLVPVAAILVSAAIAIGLAMVERRASARSALRTEAAQLIRSLNELSRDIEFRGREQVDESHNRAQADLAAFKAHLIHRDAPVGEFLDNIFHRMMSSNRDGLILTPLWLSDLLGEWIRGALNTKAFIRSMPSTDDALWQTPDPKDWAEVLKGDVPREE